MASLSIGQVAKRTGLRTSALRYYEEAGILPSPARINRRRVYDADTVRRIEVLKFAQQAGFTLGEIKTLLHGFRPETPLSARWRALAQAKLDELDVLAKRIKRMRRALDLGLKCGCVRIEDCTLTAADVEIRSKQRASARCDGRC
ncbi:MAG TPA: MerR family transcriptional regulator [Steroidobacteraceae bacterium]|jgi:MerR family transcriptional regulator, redox-sensitive transcriptional activator SoxR|nr:MerR family transcriptional regulator [Steroidobacteraceae bacterium]